MCTHTRTHYPLHPTRANPFPKVTGLFCRLPLPALFILSRGCSPWGPDAVIGTPRREISLQMDFQGLSMAYWTPGTPRRSSHKHLFRPIIGFHRVHSQVKQKRKLCPVPPLTSPPQFASPLPHPCARILTRFPFADRRTITTRLRNDSPTPNQCSRGTLPRFALQGSRLNICYYHQDLH